ncbi:signal transduction histidine kinase [Chaetomium tenue]|uniref:Signal transduction histidine kinase n=1 Tax=Chaetomium tenue TaxID=1854479 RepID=A0ACB7NWY3_9PEZI|nr:signal transduction histidine kinase [Chaetomium globosum]
MNGFDDRDSPNIDEMAQFGDHVDDATFSQILEMDESEADRDFSKPLVYGFFEQATETFQKIEAALKASNLDELSSLGHFLKGSSATLGFNKIKDSCQIIQQYGHRQTVDGNPEPDEEVCLKKISEALKQVKLDTDELENRMTRFFEE